MRAICVDDEELILNMTVKMCQELGLFSEVHGFSDANEAIAFVQENQIDIAILDIDMPEKNGIEMARIIKNCHPYASIMFLTGYSEYALEAYSLHATGYLLKPISKEKLENELKYAIERRNRHTEKPVDDEKDNIQPDTTKRILVKTFGEFDIFVDGEIVNFKRAKSKELLAYLVDREGGTISRATAFAVLWEDDEYDRKGQKRIDVIIRSLRETLRDYKVSDILSVEKGQLRIVPEKLDCDLYRFLAGDIEVINHYRGEYMNQYSWGTITEGLITSRLS
ncbi:Transcriptional regulatory protein, C terminal [Lachnospiraceae bacterium NE2001]|nr:Transcriptional regulatory protein, C terminal [Lachnospiraceae bacterium NE2001]